MSILITTLRSKQKLTATGPERNSELEARITIHRTHRRGRPCSRIIPRASTTSKRQRNRPISNPANNNSISTATTIWPCWTRHGSILGGSALVISAKTSGYTSTTITRRTILPIVHDAQMAILGSGVTAPATRRKGSGDVDTCSFLRYCAHT